MESDQSFSKWENERYGTRGLSTLNHQLVFAGNAFAGSDEVAPFIRVNHSKASDLDKYLELEKTMWQPFIKGQMDTGNTSQVSWFSAVKIMPFGADFPFCLLYTSPSPRD